MKKQYFNLQLFADGGGEGAGAAPGTESGSGIGSVDAGKEPGKGKSNSLSDVIYGKQEESQSTAGLQGEKTDTSTKTKSQSFDELIKGEYKEEFHRKTQDIINKRFKDTRLMQEQINSQSKVLSILGDKYGVDASKDLDALMKAIEEDESFYEDEAMKKGVTVEQLKTVKRLERENKALKEAQREAEKQENSRRIYSEWEKQAQQLKDKYGLENFSLEDEINNPDFTSLLANGVSVESAYKAIHMDEMLGGAMAKTASEVRKGISNSIASRQGRPTENGMVSKSSQVFKKDVNSLTKADRDEIERRVMRGEIIKF